MTGSTKHETAPANLLLRVNAFPKEGFSLVVDGKFKQHFGSVEEAQKAAISLKIKFPLLQVTVRDAVTAERMPINLPE